MIRALILTATLIAGPALAYHDPRHTVVAPTKKSVPTYDTKKWLPPLEIQNKKK